MNDFSSKIRPDEIQEEIGNTSSPPTFNAWGVQATRTWCRQNASLIQQLSRIKALKMYRTRFWEYPWVFSQAMTRPNSRILDIGIGDGVFGNILSQNGHEVIGVDNYESCWTDLEKTAQMTGLKLYNGDARKLDMFQDNEFDIAMLISMIEHVPSNTIFCEKRQTMKTGPMLKAENPEKRQVIDEALRVVKPGGMVIITTDIYLDFPNEMNISWRDLVGLAGVDRCDVGDFQDLYFCDNPIHKGRILPIGIVLEKS